MGKKIVIRLLRDRTLYYECEAACHLLCDFISAVGGIAWAAWQGDEIRIHVRRVSSGDLRMGLDAYCKGTAEADGTLFVIEMEDDAPLPPEDRIAWGTVLREPSLTRELLFSLPSGCYVLSRSGFARRLSKDRELALRRAAAEGALGRTCYIAWSAAEHDEQKRAWLAVLEDPDPDWYFRPSLLTAVNDRAV